MWKRSLQAFFGRILQGNLGATTSEQRVSDSAGSAGPPGALPSRAVYRVNSGKKCETSCSKDIFGNFHRFQDYVGGGIWLYLNGTRVASEF